MAGSEPFVKINYKMLKQYILGLFWNLKENLVIIVFFFFIQIKVYDEVTRKKILNLGGEELYPPGHNSRIYCVKFKPNDP